MISRHRAREVALQILYRYDVSHPNGDAASSHELVRELGAHFDHFQVPQELREFSGQLVAGALNDRQELDSILETHAANWKVSRMTSVDRSLLRMSVYELKAFPETDISVVIDEAVELAKEFGTAETPSFVNGILDSVSKALRK